MCGTPKGGAATDGSRSDTTPWYRSPLRTQTCVFAAAFFASGFVAGRVTAPASPEPELAALLDPSLGRRASVRRTSARLKSATEARVAGSSSGDCLWRERLGKLRAFPVTGPVDLCCLRETLLSSYGPRSMGAGDRRQSDFFMSYGQVPTPAFRFMRYLDSEGRPQRTNPNLGHWEKNWSAGLVGRLRQLAALRSDEVGPSDYPFAAAEHYRAIDAFPVEGKRVLVAGSISPWIEAIVLARGAESVVSVDYAGATTDAPGLRALTMSELRSRPRGFDCIFSYSSIEHDGLGRYGDPIHPLGDLAAVGEFAALLRPGGTLFLGLPVGKHGVADKGCRIYNRRRFERLTAGWELLAAFSPPPLFRCCPYPGLRELRAANQTGVASVWEGDAFWREAPIGKDDWRYQPIFVMRPGLSRRAIVDDAIRRVGVAASRQGRATWDAATRRL